MRYELRWANGMWQLFDSFMYESLAAFGLRSVAEEAVLDANERLAKRGRP
jgi:hypothetical protein